MKFRTMQNNSRVKKRRNLKLRFKLCRPTTRFPKTDDRTSPQRGVELDRTWHVLRRLAPLLRPHWGQLLLLFVLNLAGVALSLAYPLVAGRLVDQVLVGGQAGLNRYALLVAALGIGGLLASGATSYLYTWTTTGVLIRLRDFTFDHLLRLPLIYHRQHRVGDLVARLSGDLTEVQNLLTDGLISLVSAVFTIVITTAAMFWLSPRLAAATVGIFPLAAWLSTVFNRRLAALARDVRDQDGQLHSIQVEHLRGITTVKLLSAEPAVAAIFRDANRALARLYLRSQLVNTAARTLPALCLTIALVIIFWLGGRQVLAGKMSLGSLVAFLAYQGRLLSPWQGLFGAVVRLQRVRAALDRVGDVLEERPELPIASQARSQRSSPAPASNPEAAPINVSSRAQARQRSVRSGAPQAGAVVFRDVSFTYPGGERGLADVSFAVPAGQVVGVVGPNGAGKSTLAWLLLGLYLPDSGAITIDGTPVSAGTLRQVRRQVAYVGPDAALLHGTIAENITFGLNHVDPADLEAACRAAGLDAYIRRLPQGYDTPAGEGGVLLSAGERQRVALARVFLRQPLVLVLDEATAHLDSPTAASVQHTVHRLMADRTLFIITHRIRDLQVDRILVLDSGRLVQDGTPEQLHGSGLYGHLWQADGSGLGLP